MTQTNKKEETNTAHGDSLPRRRRGPRRAGKPLPHGPLVLGLALTALVAAGPRAAAQEDGAAAAQEDGAAAAQETAGAAEPDKQTALPAAQDQSGSGKDTARAPQDTSANGTGGEAETPVIAAADILKVPEIVVTPTRFETPAGEVGSSVSVLTAADAERLQKPAVIDALRTLPGLAITRSGGPGTTSLVRMRGADEGGTLVLFDGIKMNDPADARGAFDFDGLLVNGLDRIEVLRGPQSALYGSEAMGGVINILSERGKGPPAVSALGEYGTYNTFRQQASLSGSVDAFSYAANVANFRTDGISAVAPPVGVERDGAKSTSANGRFGVRLADNLDVDIVTGWMRLDTNFDPSSTMDGPSSLLKNTYFGKVEPKLALFDGRWENILRVSGMRTERDFDQPPFPPRYTTFNGTRLTLDYQSNVKVDHDDVFTFGAERETEEATSSRSADGVTLLSTSSNKTATNSVFAQYLLGLFDSLYVTAGLRHDNNDAFGANTTERVSAAYVVADTDTTIRGSWGTAVKAPTLSQLFDPSFGNPALQPEETTGWDAGIEQRLFGDRVTAGATYFHNDFTNLIQFAFPEGFSNVGKAMAEGVETVVTVRPDPDWEFQVNYTYTRPKNLITGKDLRRRPRDAVNASLFYSFIKGGQAGLVFRHYGARFDDDANTTRIASYSVFDLVASYDVTENLSVFGRIENVGDERYQELARFGTPGRSVFAGASVRF
jgi:vitamin B12 transporter